MEPDTTPATHLPKPKTKTKLRAKTRAKIKARLQSEPKKKEKATLLSLPAELILKIADHFLDDYLSWRNGYPSTYRGNIRQLDLFRSCTAHEVQYISLARTHRVFWDLLKGRKIADAVLKEAKAKAKARSEGLVWECS